MEAAPVAEEFPSCPVCDTTTAGTVIGRKGRFGLDVTNVICPHCALVYQSPRPTPAAMAAYYAGAYRVQYRSVRLPLPDGTMVPGDDPRFEDALDHRSNLQARTLRELTRLDQGATVLEIGCRHGGTLRKLREQLAIQPYGIEPDQRQAARAREAGIPCSEELIEVYDPGPVRFRLIQAFHVWEHLHAPLAALTRVREWLEPDGQIFLEVPNVCRPYGLLEENFFQNAHLTNFSENTLGELMRRAGFIVESVQSSGMLMMVGRRADIVAEALPLPFDRYALRQPEQDATWIGERLTTYADLEKLRALSRHGRLRGPLIGTLARALRQPAFIEHSVGVVSDIVPALLERGQLEDALLVARVAAQCPPAPEMAEPLRRLLRAVESLVSRDMRDISMHLS